MRLVHPHALMPVKLGGRPVADPVINAVWGFFSLYVLSIADNTVYRIVPA